MATYIGIAFPFQKGPTGFPATATDDDLIKQSLIQLLLTGRGERLMRPTVGSNIFAFTFEDNDALLTQQLQTEISLTIQQFEPRVILQSVNVFRGDPTNPTDDTSISVTINYVVVATRTQDTATLTLPGGAP